MNCPKCGSNNVHVITNTVSTEKGFNGLMACIGVILFQWAGLLCGFCGSGRETRTRTQFICQNCGKRF